MSEEIKETKEEQAEEDIIVTDETADTEEDKVPLDFSYYKKTDSSVIPRFFLILAGCAVFFIVFIGMMKTLDKKTNKSMPVNEFSVNDSYQGSPYADDTVKLRESMTENGLYYTEYEKHIRITGYRDILYPFDLELPAVINGKPVAEVDYYVFTYSVLKSLTVPDPECIFFEDGSSPPVAVEVTIAASEDSKAHEMAEKYGNPFTAK